MPIVASPTAAPSGALGTLDDALGERAALACVTPRNPASAAPRDPVSATLARRPGLLDLLDCPPAVADQAPTVVWTATGLERQVFLDNTGRRGRRVRVAGAGMALVSAGWLAALVTGSIGFSNLPNLPNLPAPTATGSAARPPARVVHVAAVRHSRRRPVETAAVNAANIAAAHALARAETSAASGTNR